MKWAYGVTTVLERFTDLLPRTLTSLALAGFENPRLFVDGITHIPQQYKELQQYHATFHYPKVRLFGNWIMSLWELYVREPTADRYAIFQDDFVTYKNLRQYLERCDYPRHGYWNLYTFPQNEKQYRGWYLSNQLGKGAVGLVFNNEAARLLLKHDHMVDRPLDANRGWRKVDGGIVSAFRKMGWQEWVHNPSLVQHTGAKSTIGNDGQEQASTFAGEGFDALTLLDTPPSAYAAKPTAGRHNRIGLVGFHCPTGLGELNRQIAAYTEINTWLVRPHSRYVTSPKPDNVDLIVCKTGQTSKVEQFVKSVDTICFAEQPYYDELVTLAKRHGKRLVCVPMQEWLPPGAKGWPQSVDLFICPTKQCYDQFYKILPCAYFPWPVDTQRFKYVQRTTCNHFLYIGGHGGWGGRKGVDMVKRAKELWPAMPLIVCCQENQDWPDGTKLLPPQVSNADLYSRGDVLLCPHSVDGLGLEPMEAMACGMPVVTTDGLPWNEIPAIGKIAATIEKRRVRRPVDWYIPSPESLVAICKDLLNTDISNPSLEARNWAESRSWHEHVGEFTRLIREGKPSQAAKASQEEAKIDQATATC